MKEYKFLLVGLTQCGKCGLSMTPRTLKKENVSETKYYHYYTCSGRNAKRKAFCDQPNQKAEEIEEYVLNCLYGYLHKHKDMTRVEILDKIIDQIEITEQKIFQMNAIAEKVLCSSNFGIRSIEIDEKMEVLIKRLDILKKKRDLYYNITKNENFSKYLIESNFVKDHIELYLESAIITDNKCKVNIHSI